MVAHDALTPNGGLGGFREVFVENTKTSHNHGGPGWEYGKFLWSPERASNGSDSYALMRSIRANDAIFHILEHSWAGKTHTKRLAGLSLASGPAEVIEEEPPDPGDWAGRGSYYRVPLKDFLEFEIPLPLEVFYALYDAELRADLADRPRYYPFQFDRKTGKIQLRQGGYINSCTPRLFKAMLAASQLDVVPGEAGVSESTARSERVDVQAEYEEAKRMLGEREAFARNPALVRDAKTIRGYVCEACGFDFERAYGDIGREYIECHHVNPLAERDRAATRTTIDDVRVVCSNCHRMLHRKRPAITVEELSARMESKGS